MSRRGARRIARALTALALLFVGTGACANETAQPIAIDGVAWLRGCWESVSPQRAIDEQWMAPRGDSMVGVSRTVRGESLVGFEVVVIREADGRLAYEAHPSGQASAVFMSTTVSETEVVFENPEHDFPNRIGYRRDDAGALLGWIEGSHDGELRRIEFPYTRAACPGR